MYEKPIASFAERLKEAINSHDVSAAEVSRKTDISTAAISRYMKGDYVPKQDKMYALANFFRVNPAWLMGYDVNMESTPSIPDSIANTPIKIGNSSLNEEIIDQFNDLVAEQNVIMNKLGEVIKFTGDFIEEIGKNKLSKTDSKFLAKYNQLSAKNKAVLDSMIDTMLQAQKNTATVDGDGDVSAN